MLFEDFPFNETEGLRVRIRDNPSHIDFFELYLTNTIQQLVVDETNRYAQQYLHAHPEKHDDHYAGTWIPLDIPTLKKFFWIIFPNEYCKKVKPAYVLVYERDVPHCNFFKGDAKRKIFIDLEIHSFQ